MNEQQKRVIQAARAAAREWGMRDVFLLQPEKVALIELRAALDALDALDRAEATSMFDAVDALNGRIPDSDVCECGHRRSSHALSSQGTYRCFEVCECNHYRPKQKGGE